MTEHYPTVPAMTVRTMYFLEASGYISSIQTLQRIKHIQTKESVLRQNYVTESAHRACSGCPAQMPAPFAPK